jgi:hypothetical protein
MVKIYANLETGQNNALIQHHSGDYNFSPVPSNLFGAYAKRSVTLISFIDIGTYVSPSNLGDLAFLSNLKTLYDSIVPANVLVIAVLYCYGGYIGEAVDDCNNALTNAGFANYFNPGSSEYLPFMILENNNWDGLSAAEVYFAGLSSGTKPFTYIIRNCGTDIYRVVDKWHMSSADNGDGGNGPLPLVDVRDLIHFKKLNTSAQALDPWSPSMADLVTYAVSRITDHLNTTPSITVSIPSGSTIGQNTPITATFSKKGIGTWDSAKYSIKDASSVERMGTVNYIQFSDGGTDFSVYTVENYLAGVKENATLGLASINIDTTLSLNNTGVHDIDGSLFSLSPVSYIISNAPPQIISFKINPR